MFGLWSHILFLIMSLESCFVFDHVPWCHVFVLPWLIFFSMTDHCFMMSCLVSGVMFCFRMTIHVSGWLIIVLWCHAMMWCHAFHSFYRMLLKSMDLCLRCDQCFTFWPISSLLIFDFRNHMTWNVTWLQRSHDFSSHIIWLIYFEVLFHRNDGFWQVPSLVDNVVTIECKQFLWPSWIGW